MGLDKYQGLRLRFLVPALLVSAVITAGPLLALLGGSTVARLSFVLLTWLLTAVFYHMNSWRKQAGVGLITFSVEMAFLVYVYFKPTFPLQRILQGAVGVPLAAIVWQVTVGLSAVFFLLGAAILLWGMRAHRAVVVKDPLEELLAAKRKR